MLAYCSYEGCTSKNVPFSSLTFFTLPRDHRRQIWIQNSGNPTLKNISPNAVRSFCEKHFNPSDLKRQFNRTILYKTAVPYKYNPNTSELTSAVNKDDESRTSLNNEADVQSSSQEIELPEEVEDFNQPDQIELVDEQEQIDDEFEHVEYVSNQFSDDEQIRKQYSGEEGVQIFYDCDTISEKLREGQELSESRTYSRKQKNRSPDSVPEIKRKRIIEEFEEILLESSEEEGFKNKPTSSSDYVKEYSGISTSSSSNDYEEDKHFALSLVGYFQRLPMKKKAFAKLKILSYLTELEYEDEAKL